MRVATSSHAGSHAGSHHGGYGATGGASSWMPIFEDDSDAREAHQEKLARRIKTSVGVGNELVDLTDCGLDDENVKLLVRQLSEAETEVRRRLKEVHETGLAAAKARDEHQAKQFQPFVPDREADDVVALLHLHQRLGFQVGDFCGIRLRGRVVF